MSPARLSLREVGREAFGTYRRRWAVLLVIAVAVFAPIGLLESLAEEATEVESGDGLALAEALVAALSIGLTATIGDVFYTGVVAAAVAEGRRGQRHRLAQIARHLPYLTLLAVDLLFALIVGVGLLLLIVPGVIAFGWYALAAPVVEIEGLGVRAAFRRSRELARGNLWRVLALLLPVTVAGDALGELLASSGPWVVGEGFAGDWLGGLVASVVTAPFFALAAVVAAHHLISGASPGDRAG